MVCDAKNNIPDSGDDTSYIHNEDDKNTKDYTNRDNNDCGNMVYTPYKNQNDLYGKKLPNHNNRATTERLQEHISGYGMIHKKHFPHSNHHYLNRSHNCHHLTHFQPMDYSNRLKRC
jgi:hypothetical protein